MAGSGMFKASKYLGQANDNLVSLSEVEVSKNQGLPSTARLGSLQRTVHTVFDRRI